MTQTAEVPAREPISDLKCWCVTQALKMLSSVCRGGVPVPFLQVHTIRACQYQTVSAHAPSAHASRAPAVSVSRAHVGVCGSVRIWDGPTDTERTPT